MYDKVKHDSIIFVESYLWILELKHIGCHRVILTRKAIFKIIKLLI